MIIFYLNLCFKSLNFFLVDLHDIFQLPFHFGQFKSELIIAFFQLITLLIVQAYFSFQ